MFSDSSLDIISTLLGVCLVLANIAVWRGVYLEHDRFPKEIQDRGWSLLIRGLAAETMIALLSMTIDTISSNRQNDKIALLYERATKAENETATIENSTRLLDARAKEAEAKIADANARALQAQADLAKYKAPRSLSPTQRARITDQMHHAAPQTFDVSASGDPDSLELVGEIEGILNSAGWVQVDFKFVPSLMGTGFQNIGPNDVFIANSNVSGIQIRMNPHHSVEFFPIAEMLAHALREEDIQATATDIDEIESDNDGAIHIMVGKKP